MASVEAYRARIDALKTRVESLKGCGSFTISNLPGRMPLTLRERDDLKLPIGTVVAGNSEHVYLRVPHGDIYWASSSLATGEPDGYSLEQFYDLLSRRMMMGEQFGIVYQPSE